MKETLFQAIWHHLVGYKYYAVISNRVGTFDIALHSNICATHKEAKELLHGVASFQPVEIVTFRSRNRYIKTADGKYTIAE